MAATVATTNARIDSLTRTVADLANDVATLVAALTVAQARAQAPVAATAASPRPTVVREDTCACGFTFKRGRDVAEIATSALGLCGLKGLPAHKIS